jgi:type I restriction enzyme, S subunit
MGSAQVKKGHKQTEVGVIPEDWQAISIGELNPYVTSGSRGWARYYSKFGSPFIRITNLKRESIYLDLSDLRYVNLVDGVNEGKRTELQEKDLLISITADIGIITYVNSSISKPAYINQHISLVRFNPEDVNSKFIAYFLASECVQRLFRGSTDQGAKAGLNLDAIRKLKVAFPPIDEQRTIAQALSDIDALIASLDKLIAKQRHLKTAAMQQLLTGKMRLPGFGGEWVEKQIETEIDLLTGYPFPSSKYSDSGIKLLRGSNIKRGVTDWAEDLIQYWSEITPDISQYVLKDGDIVIAMDGSLVGRSFARLSKFDLPALLLQRVARIRSDKIEMGYLKEWICSKFFVEHCDAVKTVTAIPHISPSDIKNFQIQLPPSKKEQCAIATVLSDMDTAIAALETRRAKTQAIKQGMMQELLTGRTRLV